VFKGTGNNEHSTADTFDLTITTTPQTSMYQAVLTNDYGEGKLEVIARSGAWRTVAEAYDHMMKIFFVLVEEGLKDIPTAEKKDVAGGVVNKSMLRATPSG